MNAAYTKLGIGSFFLLVTLSIGRVANAQQLTVTSAEPGWAPREHSAVQITVHGTGFDASAVIRLLAAGTSKLGGITVKRVAFQNPKELVAMLEIAEVTVADRFDLEVQLADGQVAKGPGLLAFRESPSNAKIGCTGAEVWLRHVSCKRGGVVQ